VSSKLPSREQAIKLLRKNHCSANVVAHCKAVAKLAVETAFSCEKKGYRVDINLVEIGALLHDLGRAKTHSVNHVIAGAEIAESARLPEAVLKIIRRHIGGGITAAEAQALGWPKADYMPQSLEEKIVSYADKLIETSERVPIEVTVKRLRENKLEGAAERVQRIHDEITQIVGA
jgi:uncharacterized protein